MLCVLLDNTYFELNILVVIYYVNDVSQELIKS